MKKPKTHYEKVKVYPSIADVKRYNIWKNKTGDNIHLTFRKGSTVKVICPMQDFRAFKGDEIGKVTKADEGRMILVNLGSGDIFNFQPEDLKLIKY
jgi:hypothetical protein